MEKFRKNRGVCEWRMVDSAATAAVGALARALGAVALGGGALLLGGGARLLQLLGVGGWRHDAGSRLAARALGLFLLSLALVCVRLRLRLRLLGCGGRRRECEEFLFERDGAGVVAVGEFDGR